jgi:hypothetical protein
MISLFPSRGLARITSMKALLACLVLPFALAATAAADWVIESKIESSQLTSDTVTKIKGDKMRIYIAESPAGPMSSIVDTTTGDTIQLLHGQKTAVKTSATQLKQALDAQKQPAAKKGAPVPVLKATGQKEKIGDYECEIYTWTNGSMGAKFWVAKDHPQAEALRALEKQMRSGIFGTSNLGPDTSALPGVALKTQIGAQGFLTTTTVNSVKEQNVDAKEFEVPANYGLLALPPNP